MTERVKLGVGPEIEVDDLPEPPSWTLKNVLKIIGPSAIVLGISIGSGEWIIGPANVLPYGPWILWIATISIIFQGILGLEMTRYTQLTGEPIFSAFLRCPPGKTFWAIFVILVTIIAEMWPAWAFGAATAVATAYLGRLPGPQDASLLVIIGVILTIIAILILSVGGIIERALEIAEWIRDC